MENFVMGAIAMGSWVVALFFLRFWRETHDRLFAMFACAFALLGITRYGLCATTLAGQMPSLQEAQSYWYWVRLAAFVLILIAIIDKNRR